jgi:hypothetical protein
MAPIGSGFATGLSRARAFRSRRQPVVSLTPSVATKWLMPRLEHFLTLPSGE